MTAARLNRLAAAYFTNPEPGTLTDLLQAVRAHSVAKYHRDGELAHDIASAVAMKVWRSVDLTATKPLKQFDPNGRASFSTWLSRVSSSARTDFWRVHEKAQRSQYENDEEPVVELVSMGARALERAHYALSDPWQSKGRRRTARTPTGDFYEGGNN